MFKKFKSKIGLYFNFYQKYPISVKNDIYESIFVRTQRDDPKSALKEYFFDFTTYYQNKEYIKLLYEIVEEKFPEYLSLLNTIMLLK